MKWKYRYIQKIDFLLNTKSTTLKIYILIIQDGIGYSFGVFLPSLSEYFGTNKASTAVVFSVMNFCIQVDIILY